MYNSYNTYNDRPGSANVNSQIENNNIQNNTINFNFKKKRPATAPGNRDASPHDNKKNKNYIEINKSAFNNNTTPPPTQLDFINNNYNQFIVTNNRNKPIINFPQGNKLNIRGYSPAGGRWKF